MKTDAQFYSLVLEKRRVYRAERTARRRLAVAFSAMSVGFVCIVAAVVGLTLPRDHGTPGIDMHGGQSVTEKFPGVLGIGGADPFRNNPLGDVLSLPTTFTDLVEHSVYEEWSSQFTHCGGTRNKYEHNLYTFIHELNVPREKIERACAEYTAMFPEIQVLSAEQIEVLYTRSELDAYRYFALDTTVVVGDSFYAIGWLAEHTAAEYRKAGMTVEQVEKAYLASDKTLILQEREHIRRQLAILKGQDPDATTTVTTTAPPTSPVVFPTTAY